MDDDYAAVFAEHYPSLVRACTMIAAGDQALAEDAVVDAFVQSYPSWRRGRIESIAPYLRVAACNRVRTLASREAGSTRPRIVPSEPAEHDGFQEVVEQRQELRRLLGPLDLRERQVLVLRHYFDLREVDVAVALDLPLGTVKTLNRRAIARLQEQLTEGADHER